MKTLSCKAHFSNDTSQLAAIRSLLRQELATVDVSDDLISEVVLAVDEACANVMQYAYPAGQQEPGLALELEVQEDRIHVAITDHGTSFEPEKVPAPDLERCQTGGYGMFLMRRLMDQVVYDIQPGIKNQVRLIKSLGTKSRAH